MKRGRLRRNPSLVVVGNPPGLPTGRLMGYIHAIEYRHAEDGKNYRHEFESNPEVRVIDDRTVMIVGATSIVGDH